jgi:hemoglobin
MTQREIYVPVGGPPRVAGPSPEIYARMGESNIFAMLEDFYRELEQSSLRSMFPADMVAASQKSAAFFCRAAGRVTALSSALWQPGHARSPSALCDR